MLTGQAMSFITFSGYNVRRFLVNAYGSLCAIRFLTKLCRIYCARLQGDVRNVALNSTWETR